LLWRVRAVPVAERAGVRPLIVWDAFLLWVAAPVLAVWFAPVLEAAALLEKGFPAPPGKDTNNLAGFKAPDPL
jgi:hypothetical protein